MCVVCVCVVCIVCVLCVCVCVSCVCVCVYTFLLYMPSHFFCHKIVSMAADGDTFVSMNLTTHMAS